MHSGNIENYSFIHGYHRNNLTGKWFPLHPHTLGRALTHDEMDYNLLYSQQTVAGWRIFGLNADLTLSDDEIGNSLIFHKIRTTDTDYVRYVAAGYTENMYIWITPIYDCTEFYVNGEAFTTSTQRDCSGFVITLSETSPSIDSCDIFGINSTDTTSSKPEGWIIGSGSGSGGGSGMAPTPLPSPTVEPAPVPTEVPAPSYMSLSDNTGGEAEEGETFQFTIETKGIEGSASIGYKLGGSAVQNVEYRTSEEVNRQIIYQNKATIRIEVIKGAGRAIEIILDPEDSQGNKTNDLAHVVKIVEVSEGTPVDETPIEPTPTPTYGDVETPDPTATVVPDPTATAAPIDETRDNFLFTNCKSEGIVGEGQTIIVASAEWRAMVGTLPNAESTVRDNKGLCYGYTKPISDESNVRLEEYEIDICKCEGEPEGEPVDS
jgi:hypothetical protein